MSRELEEGGEVAEAGVWQGLCGVVELPRRGGVLVRAAPNIVAFRVDADLYARLEAVRARMPGTSRDSTTSDAVRVLLLHALGCLEAGVEVNGVGSAAQDVP